MGEETPPLQNIQEKLPDCCQGVLYIKGALIGNFKDSKLLPPKSRISYRSPLLYSMPNYSIGDLRTNNTPSVFAPQLLLWKTEDYGNTYDRLETDGRLRQLGGCITALEIYLMQCALDYFLANEGVNENKIGVAGMSYGGMYALHFAAADTRIKACYSTSFVCDVFQWVKDDWSYQNAQNTFAIAETAGLIAPRALVVAMGVNDPAYQKGTDNECQRISLYYQAFEKVENFKYMTFQGIHEVDKNDEELEFLLNTLR